MNLPSVGFVLTGEQNGSFWTTDGWLLIIVATAITLFAVRSLTATGPNYGTILIDEGTIEIHRTLLLRGGVHRLVMWDFLQEASLTGNFTNDVTLETASVPIFKSKNQARLASRTHGAP
jgi:hypothetical protein